MVDLRQTKEYANYLALDGWIVERIRETNYFIKRFPLIGSFLKLQRPQNLDFDIIDKISRKYKVFQTIIEPKNEKQAQVLQKYGFRLAKSTYLPSKTLCIDLTKSQKEIYKDLQRNIRTGIKRGDTIKTREYSTPQDLKIFRGEWKNSVSYKRYVPSLESLLNLQKSFSSKKSLFLASHNIISRIIGGVIFTISSHDRSNYITSYMYGFSSDEGRASLSSAALLYQGILWGKKMGCKVFDFEGIYDSRFPNKDWLGFTRFKHSFGGYEVTYPGTFVKNGLGYLFKNRI